MDYSGIVVYYEEKQLNFGDIHSPIIVELTLVRRTSNFFKHLKTFVEMLKGIIPASERVYDTQTKMWVINKSSFDHLLTIMQTLNVLHKQGKPVIRNNYSAWAEATDRFAQPKIDPNNFFYNTTPAPTVQTRESVSEALAQILGCSVADIGQSLDIVKKLYRKKALELHPDRNNGDGSRMSELNSLWSIYSAS